MNSLLRVAVVVLLLIVGAPFIGMFVFNVSAAAYVWQMMGIVNDTQREIDEQNATDFHGAKVVPADARGLRALRNFNDFERSRAVTLVMYMKMGDIRRGDQTPFDPDEAETYLATRLPLLARAECDMIVKAFASKCAVNRVEARPAEDMYRVDMELTFVQREPFGEVKKAPELNYVEIPINLNDMKDKKMMSDSWLSARKKYYDTVARGCTKVRKQNSNCAILSVQVSSMPERGSSSIRVVAESRYAVLQ